MVDKDNEKTIYSDRQTWIDIYRGLAIILVVLGHLEIENPLYQFIFSFHMFAFFFISGVTFQVKSNQTFHGFLYTNFIRLIIPYLFYACAWNLTNTVTQVFLGNKPDLSIIGQLKNIVHIIIGRPIWGSTASIGAAWFLIALFQVRVLFWIIIRKFHNSGLALGIISTALFITAHIFNGNCEMPFMICQMLSGCIFFYLGMISRNRINKLKFLSTKLVLLLGFVIMLLEFILSMFESRAVIMVGNTFPDNMLLTFTCGVLGCAGLCFCSISVEKNTVLSDLLSYYGRNSIIIMGIHSEINFAFRFVFYLLGVPQIPRVVCIFIFTLVLSVPFIWVINNYFPALAGRRKNERK